jgi:hypothetical protein
LSPFNPVSNLVPYRSVGLQLRNSLAKSVDWAKPETRTSSHAYYGVFIAPSVASMISIVIVLPFL